MGTCQQKCSEDRRHRRWLSPAELGWIEERNVNFAIRVAQGQVDRLPGFASEIVGLNVDVIAVIGAVTVRIVQEATSTIPIVFSGVVEPVGDTLTTIED